MFDDEDQQELDFWLSENSPSNLHRRIATVLRDWKLGQSRYQIAVKTFYSYPRVCHYISSYKKARMEGVRPKPMGRRPKFKLDTNDDYEQRHFDW